MNIALLNSGGIDSRTSAAFLKKQGHTLHSIHVHCNKRNDIASLPAAAKTAELYCDSHFIYESPTDWAMRKDNHFGVPYTFLYTHAIGAQYAFSKGYALATGYKEERDDANRLELFEKLMGGSLHTEPIEIFAPVYGKNFPQVYEMAKELGVPLEDTYSCTDFPPCAKCGTCIKRKAVNL